MYFYALFWEIYIFNFYIVVYILFDVNLWRWGEEGDQINSLVHGYTGGPASFVEEIIYGPIE